jgi:hypothetical protein
MKNKEGINTLLEVVKESKIKPYDFVKDESGVMVPRKILNTA